MSKENIQYIAKKIVENGKGILAADESTNTIKKRFNSINVESNEETRCFYRDTLFCLNNFSQSLVFKKNIKNDLLSGYDVRSAEDARAIDEEVEYLETCDLRMFMVFFWEKYGDGWDEVDDWEKERIVPRFIYSALKRREKK